MGHCLNEDGQSLCTIGLRANQPLPFHCNRQILNDSVQRLLNTVFFLLPLTPKFATVSMLVILLVDGGAWTCNKRMKSV